MECMSPEWFDRSLGNIQDAIARGKRNDRAIVSMPREIDERWSYYNARTEFAHEFIMYSARSMLRHAHPDDIEAAKGIADA